MNKNTVLTLEVFRKKAIEKEQQRIKFTDIEVDGFGLVRFNRPTDNQLIEYSNRISNAFKFNKKGEVLGQDLTEIYEANKELVYITCEFLQDKKLRESLEIKDPMDMPFKVFGIDETQNLADKIDKAFSSESVKEKVEEEVKN
ncbi:hypothetical protein [Tepidibacter mesophilus]|uniref:hypothetical protein n=1 Tax=Tepidibacter mesophilus TaxID=655607 RepID=UPI000C068677|nr:hypothetical protein [Tepidibacter mesophilus]